MPTLEAHYEFIGQVRNMGEPDEAETECGFPCLILSIIKANLANIGIILV
jgi:hypothetical protein